jgi:iron complex outermembrane receptor protein
VSLSPTYNFVMPKAGAVFTLGPTSNLYATVARGMREPFLSSIYNPEDYYATPVSLTPEDVWDIEGGLSLQRPLWRMRGNVFWMNFLNEIVYAGALDDNGVPIYGNGARSRRRGAELDGTVILAPHVNLDAALTLSRNTFTKYREFDFEGGSVVYDGHRLGGFPDLMASVTLRGEWRGTTTALSVRRVGRFYLDNTQDATRVNDAYTVVDASANVPLPAAWARHLGLSRTALALKVNNLFDRRYTTFGYVDGSEALYIPAAGRNVFLGCTFGL